MRVKLASGKTIVMAQDAIWMKENLEGYPAGLNYSVKDYNNSVNRLKLIRDLEGADLFFGARPGPVQGRWAASGISNRLDTATCEKAPRRGGPSCSQPWGPRHAVDLPRVGLQALRLDDHRPRLSFTVEPGEIVGFLGPNGAGKTTTMRMIAGYTAATSGRVTVAGFDMATQNVEAARRIGYLPERPPLYDALDVSAYLRFVARVKGVRAPRDRRRARRVSAACRWRPCFVTTSTSSPRATASASGWPRRCSDDPEVLLLDEPTAGLDPARSTRRAR